MESWNLETKNLVRSRVCKFRDKTYENILVLPGVSALDVKELSDNCAINPKTNVFAIEKESDICTKLPKVLAEYVHKYFLINKEVHKVDLEHDCKGWKLDFVYIDTCSQLTEFMIAWLKELKSKETKLFTDGAVVCLAFCHYKQEGFKTFKKLKNSQKTWLTLKETAELVGITVASVKELVQSKKLKSKKLMKKDSLGRSHSLRHVNIKDIEERWHLKDKEAEQKKTNNKQEFPEIIGKVNGYLQLEQHEVMYSTLHKIFGHPTYNLIYKNTESNAVMHLFEFILQPNKKIDTAKKAAATKKKNIEAKTKNRQRALKAWETIRNKRISNETKVSN